MGSNAESLAQCLLGSRFERGIGKIQALVSWKCDVYHLFERLIYIIYTSDLLVTSHSWPPLVQWNTAGVFHDDVFAANGV
jgi:hypothetical protein